MDLAAVQENAAALALLGDVEAAETAMLSAPQVECPVVHHFGPGIYIREVHMPAGTIAIGHHQNFEHMNFFIKGRVIMLNPDGSTSELVAPMLFTGKPGRKIGYVLEDVVWQNIYPTTETDVPTLEATYLTKSDAWLQHDDAAKELAYFRHQTDRDDYAVMLQETGFTHEQALAMSENEEDMMPMDGVYLPYAIADSQIQGKGYFLTAGAEAGQLIAMARVAGKRTPAGRFVNHSISPNARMVPTENGDIALVACRPIAGCQGGNYGEEVTIDYRQALALSIPDLKEGKLCQQ